MANTPEEALHLALQDLDRDPRYQDPARVEQHLESVRRLSASFEPKHTAQLYELHRRTNTPMQLLMKAPKKQLDRLQAPGLAVGTKDTKLREYLEDPYSAAVSRNDISKLMAGEARWTRYLHKRDKDTGWMAGVLHAVTDQGRSADIQEELSELGHNKLIRGEAVDEELVKNLQDELIALSFEEKHFGDPQYAAGAVSNLAVQGLNALKEVVPPALVGGVAAAGTVGTVAAVGGLVAGGSVAAIPGFLALAGLGTAFGVGATTGGSIAAANRAFRIESGLAALELADERDDTRTEEFPDGRPLDKDIIWATAVAIGSVNALLEVGGFAAVGRAIFSKSPLGKRFGRMMVTDAAKTALKDTSTRAALKDLVVRLGVGVGGEVSTEGLQQIVQIVLGGEAREEAVERGKASYADLSTFRPGDAGSVRAVMTKAAFGLGIPSGMVAGTKLAHTAYQNRLVLKAVEANEDLAVIQDETETKANSPGKNLEYNQAIGATEEFGLDARESLKLYEERPDLFNKLDIEKATIEEAVKTGQDVPIQQEVYNSLLTAEDRVVLNDHLRVNDYGPTFKEAKDANPSDDIAEILESDDARSENEKSLRRELSRVRKEFKDAGLTPESSKQSVKLLEQFTRRMGEEANFRLESVAEKIKAVARKPAEGETGRAKVTFIGIGDPLVDYRTGEVQRTKDTGEVVSSDRDEALVQIFKGSGTVSSIPHELQHIFTKEMNDWADSGSASPEFLADWTKFKKAFKIQSAKDLTEQDHENVANTFEAFLLDGVAPSEALQGTFERFRTWLKGIYRDIIGRALPLTDDIRNAFNRMLATEAQVEQAMTVQELTELGAQVVVALGAIPEVQRQLNAPVNRLRQSAVSKAQKELDKGYRERRAAARKIIASEVNKLPVNRLRTALNKGGRFSAAEVSEEFGTNTKQRMNQVRASSKKGERPMRITAVEFGFESMNDMVDTLIGTPSKSDQIQQRLDAEMAGQDQKVNPADIVLSEEGVQDIIDANQKALDAVAGISKKESVKRSRLAIKREALRRFSNLNVKHANNPSKFKGAFRRSMLDFFRKTRTLDFVGASEALATARMNFEMHRFSLTRRDKIARDKKRATKNATSPKARAKETMREEYREHIKRVGHSFGFLTRGTRTRPNLDLDILPSLQDLIGGIDPSSSVDTRTLFPDWVTKPVVTSVNKQGQRVIQVNKPYTDLTVQQYDTLVDLLDHLAHQGKFLVKDATALSDLSYTELKTTLMAKVGTRPGPLLVSDADSAFIRMTDGSRSYLAELEKPHFLWDKLDAGDPEGPHKTVVQARWRQQERGKLLAQEKVTEQSQPFLEQLTKTINEGDKRLDTTVTRPKVFEKNRRYLTTTDAMGFFLHMGNAHNKQAAIDGYGTSEADMRALFGELTVADLKALEGLANVVETLWPGQVEVHRKTKGYTPTQVLGDPFQVEAKDGTFESKGWYWPLTPDPTLDPKSKEQNQALEVQLSSAGMFPLNSGPPAGQLIQRSGSFGGRPPSLNPFSTLGRHLQHALTYIHYAEVYQDTVRMLRDAEYKDVVHDKFGGVEVTTFLQKAYENVVHGEFAFQTSVGSMFSKLRSRTANQFLLGKWSTGAKQFFSAPLYMTHKQGSPTKFFSGLYELVSHPSRSINFIYEQSVFMRDRSNAIEQVQREDLSRAQTGKVALPGSVRKQASELKSIFIAVGDILAAGPAWLGEFRANMEATNGDIDASVTRADNLIRETQPSTSPLDQSFAQRQTTGAYSLVNFFGGWRFVFGGIQRQDVDGLRTGALSRNEFVRNVAVNWIGTPIAMQAFMHYAFFGRDRELTLGEILTNVALYNVVAFPGVSEVLTYAAHKKGLIPYGDSLLNIPSVQVAETAIDALLSFPGLLYALGSGDAEDGDLAKAVEDTVTLGSMYHNQPFHRVYEASTEGVRQAGKKLDEGGILSPFQAFNVLLSPDPEARER